MIRWERESRTQEEALTLLCTASLPAISWSAYSFHYVLYHHIPCDEKPSFHCIALHILTSRPIHHYLYLYSSAQYPWSLWRGRGRVPRRPVDHRYLQGAPVHRPALRQQVNCVWLYCKGLLEVTGTDRTGQDRTSGSNYFAEGLWEDNCLATSRGGEDRRMEGRRNFARTYKEYLPLFQQVDTELDKAVQCSANEWVSHSGRIPDTSKGTRNDSGCWWLSWCCAVPAQSFSTFVCLSVCCRSVYWQFEMRFDKRNNITQAENIDNGSRGISMIAS